MENERKEKKEKKQGFFSKLAGGLTKTKNNIAGMVGQIFSGREINEEFYEELEEALLIADVGYPTTERILEELRAAVKEQHLRQTEEARSALQSIVADMMRSDKPFMPSLPAVVLIVGVNGVGKTTSIGKMAHYYSEEGERVLLAAADTFRAAATEQLVEWANRADVPIIKQGEGADPAAVVFDAAVSAKAKGIDVLLCDTAGRLHNKKNLMSELGKIERVLEREFPQATRETLLVLDATTGQNAIAQAKVFAETVKLSGIVLTKLDGTAKGGVVLAIKEILQVPVRFIGVGEGIDDLQPFDADDFARAMFEQENNE